MTVIDVSPALPAARRPSAPAELDLTSYLLPTTRLHRPGLSGSELSALVAAVAADPRAWRSRLVIPAPGADRWWHRLASSTAVDVWLLSWLPGHTTALHDHGGSTAAFTVVQGVLGEDRATPDHRRVTYVRRPGTVAVIPVGVRHDVTGTGAAPAVSVHAYSPPLTVMNYYDDAGSVVRTVRTHEPEEELRR